MSKVILSSVFLNLRNVRNFSAVTSSKNWDVSSGHRTCPDTKYYRHIAARPTLRPSCFPSSTARWCSTGSVPPALGALTESIPSAPGSAEPIFENLPSIPLPPSPAPPIEQIVELAVNGEPTLRSLGLGGWWPRGLVEEGLMAIHVYTGLPWWGTIMVGATVMRLCMFPLTIKSQRASAKMAVHMPKLNETYEKMTEARKQDDPYLVYKYAKQIEELQKQSGSPLASVWPGLAQAPFIYFFFSALREMSTYPLESFKTGGTLWFPDLTVPDDYYGLPILTSIGLFSVLQLGHQSFKAMKYGQYIPYGLAPVSFLITMWFTNALGVYWVAASLLNFIQALILRNPTVREKLDLAPMVSKQPLKTKKKKSEGFLKDMKKNMENSRIAREVEDRYRLDAIAFEKAGKEPVRKTYKLDPTKTPLPKV